MHNQESLPSLATILGRPIYGLNINLMNQLMKIGEDYCSLMLNIIGYEAYVKKIHGNNAFIKFNELELVVMRDRFLLSLKVWKSPGNEIIMGIYRMFNDHQWVFPKPIC